MPGKARGRRWGGGAGHTVTPWRCARARRSSRHFEGLAPSPRSERRRQRALIQTRGEVDTTGSVQEGSAVAWNRTPSARHLVHASPPSPARMPRGASPFPAASRAARFRPPYPRHQALQLRVRSPGSHAGGGRVRAPVSWAYRVSHPTGRRGTCRWGPEARVCGRQRSKTTLRASTGIRMADTGGTACLPAGASYDVTRRRAEFCRSADAGLVGGAGKVAP